jgi:hypothetical protein
MRSLPFKVQVHSQQTSNALQYSIVQLASHLRLAVFSYVEDMLSDRLECTFQLAATAQWRKRQRHGCVGRQLWNGYTRSPDPKEHDHSSDARAMPTLR